MKVWLCFIFGVMSTVVYSQAEIEVPLRAYFKPEPIKQNKVKSLVVFLDVYGEAIDGIQRNGKILEIEFDSTGNVCYKLSADSPKRNSFLDYAGDQRVEYTQFDERGELVYLHRENDDEIFQLSREYDDQGNMIESTAEINGRKISNHHFSWEGAKMTQYTNLYKEEDPTEYIYDDLGRIVQLESGPFRMKYEYEQEGEMVNVIETVQSDETSVVYKYAYHQDFKDHYTYYANFNEDGGLDLKMDVSYDAFGNAASYRFFNRSGDETPAFGNPSIYYRIENNYDKNDLLISRKFYLTRLDSTEESLARVERYIYNSEPLVTKFEEGELYEEYNNNY